MKRLLVLALLGAALAACTDPSAAVYRAVALGNVAAAQAEAGDLAGAGETAVLALEAAKTVAEKNYPAWALSAAAVAQARAGDAAGARDTRALALEITPRVHKKNSRDSLALGEEHPRAATSLNNLASLYRVQGRYAEAEPLYQRSLAIREKALAAEHPHVADSLENYAALLRKTGRDIEAVKLEARAKAIRAKHAEENPVN